MVAGVNMVLKRTSHVAVRIFPKMLFPIFFFVSRIEGNCDRPVVLEESTTLAGNP